MKMLMSVLNSGWTINLVKNINDLILKYIDNTKPRKILCRFKASFLEQKIYYQPFMKINKPKLESSNNADH